MMSLPLTGLGDFQIVLAGAARPVFPTDKVRALLVYLVVEGAVARCWQKSYRQCSTPRFSLFQRDLGELRSPPFNNMPAVAWSSLVQLRGCGIVQRGFTR